MGNIRNKCLQRKRTNKAIKKSISKVYEKSMIYKKLKENEILLKAFYWKLFLRGNARIRREWASKRSMSFVSNENLLENVLIFSLYLCHI